jgi:hypothetical protein
MTVPCVVDPQHRAQLTRPDMTAAVHYVSFALTEEQIQRFATGPVTLAIQLPGYSEATVLSEETRASLLMDQSGKAKRAWRSSQILHPNVMWYFQNVLDSAGGGKEESVIAGAYQLSRLGRSEGENR